jgi:uncharacterized integral membrane protein
MRSLEFINLKSTDEAATQMPASELPAWLILLLAAGLGIVVGAVLSFAQWLVLRQHLR